MTNNDDTSATIIKEIDSLNYSIWHMIGRHDDNANVFEKGINMLEKARSINYKFGEAQCLLNIGLGIFVIKNDKVTAFDFLNNALEIFKEFNDDRWIANTYLTQALIHNTLIEPEAALYKGLKGMSYYENHEGYEFDTTLACYILGTIYKDLKKFNEAEFYYQKGMSITPDKENLWAVRIYTSLANIYTFQENYSKALDISLKALEIFKNDRNNFGASRALTDIGIIYRKLNEFDKALNYMFDGLKIRDEQKLSQFILTSLMEIAYTYYDCKNYDQAIIYYLKSENIAKELSLDSKLIRIYKEMANAYKELSDFFSAVMCYEKLITISNALHQSQLNNKISTLNNELLKEKEAEIEKLRNVELKAAYNLIEEKNKEILQSMRYASRIQKTLLPSEKFIEKNIIRLKK